LPERGKPPIVLTEAAARRRESGSWLEHRRYPEESGTLADRRAANLAGEVFAVAARGRSRGWRPRSRRTRSCDGSSEVQRRELDPLTAVREIMERVFEVRNDNRDGPDTR
jgi:hypothetical protein